MGTNQAGNLIINRFLGVTINAAYGVANQVQGAITAFVSNFQVAYTPQIVKLYAQNRLQEFYKLSNGSALLSYYIMFIISFPILVNIDFVLGVWLVDVPMYAGAFCSLLIIYALIDSIQAPFWIGINASGNIKIYEIWLSALLIINIPFSYLALKWVWKPYWVVAIRVLLNFISAICRCVHVKIQLDFPIKDYLLNVVLRALLVTSASILVWFLIPHDHLYSTIGGFIVVYVVSVIVIGVFIFLFGLGKSEKNLLLSFITQFFSIKRTKRG